MLRCHIGRSASEILPGCAYVDEPIVAVVLRGDPETHGDNQASCLLQAQSHVKYLFNVLRYTALQPGDSASHEIGDSKGAYREAASLMMPGHD
jgi:hypothetical protein